MSQQEAVPSVVETDATVTIDELKSEMRDFVDQRDWRQFHSPKNLSMSVSIEAAELMEHFQWLSQEQSRQMDDASVQQVGEELADVMCYLIALANELEIDIATTLRQKMVKNREKYPAEKFRGRYGQKDLDQRSEA